MKTRKRFARLSKTEQKKVELEYHGMRPEEFKELMANARPHTPTAIRLPKKLIETLKTFADMAGEREYQTMVQRWIRERLKQEDQASSRVRS